MKKALPHYLLGYLMVIGLTIGAYSAFWGTDLSNMEWDKKRTHDLIRGCIVMGLCGWMLLDRSNKSQIFKTLALSILVAAFGCVAWFEIIFSFLPGETIRIGKLVQAVVGTLGAGTYLLYLGAPKAAKEEDVQR
jgi:hypothetical protein